MTEGEDYVGCGEEEGGDGPAEAAFDTGEKQEDAAEDEEYPAPDSRETVHWPPQAPPINVNLGNLNEYIKAAMWKRKETPPAMI